jgi:hypothetical protein
MKKLLLAATLFVSSLALAQATLPHNLPDLIQKEASVDFLFTGMEPADLKKLMGDPKKLGTSTINTKDAGGFESSYKVTKTDNFVQIFESKMVYWMTFNLHATLNDFYVSMVTSAQKDSNGRGNDLEFYSLKNKKRAKLGTWYDDVVKFANGKCKVPKENIHFALKDGSDTIKISGFDIFLTGKKYTLSGEVKLVAGQGGVADKVVFDPKTAKC